MTEAAQIFRDSATDQGFRAKWWTGRVIIYGLLIFWAFIALFPIYWTISTSFKMAPDVMKAVWCRGGTFNRSGSA